MTMRRGFTIIELLVAIPVVGVFLASFIPRFVEYRESARRASVKNNMHVVQIALEAWATDHHDNLPGATGHPFCMSEDSLDIRPWFPGGNPFAASGRPVLGRFPANPYTTLSYNDENGNDMDLLYGAEWGMGQADGPGRVSDGDWKTSIYRGVVNPTSMPGLIGVACYASDGVHVSEYGVIGYGRDTCQPMYDRNPNCQIRTPVFFVLHN